MSVTSGASSPDRPSPNGRDATPGRAFRAARGRSGEAARPDFDTLYREAAHELYQKLAFVSAAIWAVGCVILFILLAADSERPVFGAAMAMTLPLIPAALPWPAYPLLSRWLAARRLRAQTAART